MFSSPYFMLVSWPRLLNPAPRALSQFHSRVQGSLSHALRSSRSNKLRSSFPALETACRPLSTASPVGTAYKIPASSPPTPKQDQSESASHEKQEPSYELTFTCKPCGTRSSKHKISKQSYHHGSVLITCPGCKARHVITDHLQIFSSGNFNLEDFMKDNGSLVKRGRLEGDMEFWDDGTVTARKQDVEWGVKDYRFAASKNDELAQNGST